MVAGAEGAPAARSARDKLAQPRTARRRNAPGRPKYLNDHEGWL